MLTFSPFIESSKTRLRNVCLFCIVVLLLASCSKEFTQPAKENVVPGFRLSESSVVLLEGNAAKTGIAFDWETNGNNATYTIEAVIHGSSFDEPLEIGSTKESDLRFSVQEFNKLMCELLYANRSGAIDFRIREDVPSAHKAPTYSCPLSLNVTTYKSYINYPETNVFKLPGNYQNWDITTAPLIVAKENSGEYEGYVKFTKEYPQLLMVKGSQWDPQITFTNIGAEKFGFGGSMISVFGGAGVYLFKANTNTSKWSYTKINSWSITGSASANATQLEMSPDKEDLSWVITTQLVKGEFRITANKTDDDISFGHSEEDPTGVPSYDGGNLVIKKAGLYTIKLELNAAGNYNYSIQKIG